MKGRERSVRPPIIIIAYIALRTINDGARQKTGRWLNNRAEKPHQPLR